jgi:hypothetical protein
MHSAAFCGGSVWTRPAPGPLFWVFVSWYATCKSATVYRIIIIGRCVPMKCLDNGG